jgi:hypothetical protein
MRDHGSGQLRHWVHADAVLKGGLGLGELHELAPIAPFTAGRAALRWRSRRCLVPRAAVGDLGATGFRALETGALYGLGCDLFGLASSRLLVVRTSTPRDTLWAMRRSPEDPWHCGGDQELAQEGQAADLTRHAPPLAAAQQGGRLCLLLRQRPFSQPDAAATPGLLPLAPGSRDGFSGLGRTAWRLSLDKKSPRTMRLLGLQWDHHAKRFLPGAICRCGCAVSPRIG